MSLEDQYLNSNKYTYEYFCQENVCRLCWETTNNGKSIENDDALAEIIVEHIGLNVKGHILQKVCCTCLDKIESFANFKKFCLEADKKLQVILSTDHSKRNVKIADNYHDLIIVKKEKDLELKLLAGEVKKEETVENWMNESNLNLEDFQFGSDCDDEFLPLQDDYCYMCKLKFESIDRKLKHDVEFHKMLRKTSYKCYYCMKVFSKLSQKISHEIICKVSRRTVTKKINNSINTNHGNSMYPLKVYKENKQTNDNCERKGIFQCNFCSETFKNYTDLKKHKLNHRKRVCEICGRIVSNSNSLAQHMMIHNKYKEVKCPYCDHKSTLKYNIAAHIRRVHKAERQFACHLCPLRCFTRSILNRHLKTHFGIKDFKCQICDKSVSSKKRLQEHIKVVHEGLRRFICKQCDVKYNQFESLRKHMLKIHGKKIKQRKDDFVEVDSEDKDKVNNETESNCDDTVAEEIRTEDSCGVGEEITVDCEVIRMDCEDV